MNKADIKERIVRSRVQLLIKFPFYGTLALMLQLKEEPSCKTAATDGEYFYYNVDFIDSLTEAELNWIMAHEVMHCALGHLWRRSNRLAEKWNVAADYAIHSMLKESECSDFKMPKGCLYDERFNDKSTEEIYELIPNPPSIGGGMGQDGQGQGQGQGDQGQGQGQNGKGKQQNGSGSGDGYPQTIDDHSMWDKSQTQANKQEKQQTWREKMMSAAEVAESKSQGSVPGGIKRLIGSIRKPQKNWRQLLAEFVQFETFDFGFVPPDNRYYGYSEDYYGTEIIMPSYSEEREKLQDIVFVIDTSGSIGDDELIAFFSELVGMMGQFSNSVKGHILYCDSEVAADYEFEDVDDILKAKPAGGGGTDMEEAIRYSMDKKEKDEWDVAGICILTDGWTSYTMKAEDIPFKVLWLVTTDDQHPTYGQVARLKI